MGKDDDVYILGTTVLKTYYTVFDAENLRVGFAYTADEKQPLSRAGPFFAALYRLTSVALYVVILVCLVRIFQSSSSGGGEDDDEEEEDPASPVEEEEQAVLEEGRWWQHNPVYWLLSSLFPPPPPPPPLPRWHTRHRRAAG